MAATVFTLPVSAFLQTGGPVLANIQKGLASKIQQREQKHQTSTYSRTVSKKKLKAAFLRRALAGKVRPESVIFQIWKSSCAQNIPQPMVYIGLHCSSL